MRGVVGVYGKEEEMQINRKSVLHNRTVTTNRPTSSQKRTHRLRLITGSIGTVIFVCLLV
jgi:hypothetical protein